MKYAIIHFLLFLSSAIFLLSYVITVFLRITYLSHPSVFSLVHFLLLLGVLTFPSLYRYYDFNRGFFAWLERNVKLEPMWISLLLVIFWCLVDFLTIILSLFSLYRDSDDRTLPIFWDIGFVDLLDADQLTEGILLAVALLWIIIIALVTFVLEIVAWRMKANFWKLNKSSHDKRQEKQRRKMIHNHDKETWRNQYRGGDARHLSPIQENSTVSLPPSSKDRSNDALIGTTTNTASSSPTGNYNGSSSTGTPTLYSRRRSKRKLGQSDITVATNNLSSESQYQHDRVVPLTPTKRSPIRRLGRVRKIILLVIIMLTAMVFPSVLAFFFLVVFLITIVAYMFKKRSAVFKSEMYRLSARARRLSGQNPPIPNVTGGGKITNRWDFFLVIGMLVVILYTLAVCIAIFVSKMWFTDSVRDNFVWNLFGFVTLEYFTSSWNVVLFYVFLGLSLFLMSQACAIYYLSKGQKHTASGSIMQIIAYGHEWFTDNFVQTLIYISFNLLLIWFAVVTIVVPSLLSLTWLIFLFVGIFLPSKYFRWLMPLAMFAAIVLMTPHYVFSMPQIRDTIDDAAYVVLYKIGLRPENELRGLVFTCYGVLIILIVLFWRSRNLLREVEDYEEARSKSESGAQTPLLEASQTNYSSVEAVQHFPALTTTTNQLTAEEEAIIRSGGERRVGAGVHIQVGEGGVTRTGGGDGGVAGGNVPANTTSEAAAIADSTVGPHAPNPTTTDGALHLKRSRNDQVPDMHRSSDNQEVRFMDAATNTTPTISGPKDADYLPLGVPNDLGVRSRTTHYSKSLWRKTKHLIEIILHIITRNSFYICLLFIYFVGLSFLRPNLMHSVYLVFFIVFFAFPSLAQRFWIFLVLYTMFVITALYSYNAFFYDYPDGEADKILRIIGFYPFHEEYPTYHTFFAELIWHYLILLLAALTYAVIRLRNFGGLSIQKWNRDKVLPETLRNVGTLLVIGFAQLAFVLTFVTLILIILLENQVTVFLIGFTLFLFVCLAFSVKFSRVLPFIWLALFFYTAVVLILLYFYQFPYIHDLINRFNDIPAESRWYFTTETIGFEEYSVTSLGLLPYAILLILILFQLKYTRNMKHAKRRLNASLEDTESKDLSPIISYVVFKLKIFLMRLCVLHHPKLLLIFLFIAAQLNATVIGLVYLFVVLILSPVPFVITYFWFFIAVYSELIIVAELIYNLPYIRAQLDSENTIAWLRWVGLDLLNNDPVKIEGDLVGSIIWEIVLVLVSAHIQRMCLTWKRRLVKKGLHIPGRLFEEETNAQRPESSLYFYYLVIKRRLIFVFNHFFDTFGYEISMLTLLIGVLLMIQTVWGLLFLVLFGILLFVGRRRLYRGIWLWIIVVLVVEAVILILYIFALRPFPPYDYSSNLDEPIFNYVRLRTFGEEEGATYIIVIHYVILFFMAQQTRVFWKRRGYKQHVTSELLEEAQTKTGQMKVWLSPPKDKVDFTLYQHNHTLYYFTKFLIYHYTMSVVLIVIFIDSAIRPSLIKLLEVLLVIVFTTWIDVIIWRTKRIWVWLGIFYFFILLLETLFQIPIALYGSIDEWDIGEFSRNALRVIGFKELDHFSTYFIDIFIIALYYFQERLFDSRGYIFYTNYIFRQSRARIFKFTLNRAFRSGRLLKVFARQLYDDHRRKTNLGALKKYQHISQAHSVTDQKVLYDMYTTIYLKNVQSSENKQFKRPVKRAIEYVNGNPEFQHKILDRIDRDFMENLLSQAAKETQRVKRPEMMGAVVQADLEGDIAFSEQEREEILEDENISFDELYEEERPAFLPEGGSAESARPPAANDDDEKGKSKKNTLLSYATKAANFVLIAVRWIDRALQRLVRICPFDDTHLNAAITRVEENKQRALTLEVLNDYESSDEENYGDGDPSRHPAAIRRNFPPNSEEDEHPHGRRYQKHHKHPHKRYPYNVEGRNRDGKYVEPSDTHGGYTESSAYPHSAYPFRAYPYDRSEPYSSEAYIRHDDTRPFHGGPPPPPPLSPTYSHPHPQYEREINAEIPEEEEISIDPQKDEDLKTSDSASQDMEDERVPHVETFSEKVNEIKRQSWHLTHTLKLLYFSYTDILCYLLMIINFLVNPSLFSLIYTVVALGWAAIQFPYPSKLYWYLTIAYSIFLIILQYIFYLVQSLFPDESLASEAYTYWELFGWRPRKSLVSDIILNILIIMAVVHHKNILKDRGDWGDVKAIIREQKDAANREFMQMVADPESKRDTHNLEVEPVLTNIEDLDEEDDLSDDDDFPANGADGEQLASPQGLSKVTSLFSRAKDQFVFKLGRVVNPNSKIGRDFYAFQTLIQLLLIIAILLSFPAMSGRQGDQITEISSSNNINIILVLALFAVFIIVCVDRVIYLFHSVKAKLIFQLILLVGAHILFIVGHAQMQRIDNGAGVAALRITAFLGFLYLLVSCFQIQSGYPAYTYKEFLMKDGVVYYLAFQVYRAIPFLFEMKTLIDWTFTPTTFTYYNWIKLEDIRATLFVRKYVNSSVRNSGRKTGDSQSLVTKLFAGFLLFVVLSLILFFPLFFFSNINPALQYNWITEVDLEVAVPGWTPLYTNTFRILNPEDRSIDWNDYAREYSTEKNFRDFESFERVQEIRLSPYSDIYWPISKPSRNELIDQLRSRDSEEENLGLTLTYSFTRIGPPSQRSVQKTLDIPLTDLQRAILRQMIDLSSPTTRLELQVPYNPFVINQQDNIRETSLSTRYYPNCTLSMNIAVESLEEVTDYFIFECVQFDLNDNVVVDGPGFFVQSTRIVSDEGLFSFLSGIGILAFYTTFVLTVGRFLRMYVSGLVERIPFEDVDNVNVLWSFIGDIYIARGSGDLELEERLYREALRIFRIPVVLHLWTKARGGGRD